MTAFPYRFIAAFVLVCAVGGSVLALPSLLAKEVAQEQVSASPAPFPVSVDPERKTIVENPAVDALFTGHSAAFTASAINAEGFFAWIAQAITSIPGYALLGAADTRFVTIYPGYREEQVAGAFGKALGWSAADQKKFLSEAHSTAPTLSEGSFAPGTYVIQGHETMADVQAMLDSRFDRTVRARYSTSTEAVVPLNEALTIASLLERETRDPNEMRLISGIIWNRLWNNMNLQIDATLQYAKGSPGPAASWWPAVVPKDKYIKSPYNTYQNPGLPPAPIANPSVAAVLAALNPKPTDCLFYFHDRYGELHCAPTYEEHVSLLKQYYGRGK
ncbi:MAG TPA: endolytic transglycosylase MltG [Candidatus Paceibacterota bacterium]